MGSVVNILGKWKIVFFLLIASVLAVVSIGMRSINNKICTAYQSIIHSVVRPGFVPNDDCFFKKMDRVANYTVGGLTFSAPREYFWLGGTREDGVVDAIYLMFRAPDMSPGSSYSDQQGNIAVTVGRCVQGKECVQHPSFSDRARERNCADQPGSEVEWPPGFKKISHRGSYDYYYLGKMCRPYELMVCDGGEIVGANPRCGYYFQIYSDVYVKVGFRKRDVFGKSYIIKNTLDKLSGFIYSEKMILSSAWWGK